MFLTIDFPTDLTPSYNNYGQTADIIVSLILISVGLVPIGLLSIGAYRRYRWKKQKKTYRQLSLGNLLWVLIPGLLLFLFGSLKFSELYWAPRWEIIGKFKKDNCSRSNSSVSSLSNLNKRYCRIFIDDQPFYVNYVIYKKIFQEDELVKATIFGFFSYPTLETIQKADQNTKLTKNKINFKKNVNKEQNLEEIISIFGKPDQDVGSGTHLYQYNLTDGSIVNLQFFNQNNLESFFINSKNGQKQIF